MRPAAPGSPPLGARSLNDTSTRIHHFGMVVPNIEAWLERSVWRPVGEVVSDPLQRARLCLAGLPADTEGMVELVQPLDADSPTWNALQRGPGWHHVCLSVASIDAGDALVRQRRMLPVTGWQPAVLFGGRAIRFVYSRNRELMELLADEQHK